MSSAAPELRALRDRLAATNLVLNLGGAEEARRTRDELLDQIDDYVLPRLERLDAPLLIVIGGSTGAGKSTITNTLVGDNVSTAGVLRPTTRTPVLVCTAEDRDWFLSGGVLPDLPRSTGERPTGAGLHLVVGERLPQGLAILDAPDIDSVEVANHDLAAQLLGAADLWLFVTTAARYADAVPWEYLARARERAIALAVVVNRIPPGAEDEIVTHLGDMLRNEGLDAQLFPIVEGAIVEGRIDEGVNQVREWLTGLVADADQRDALVLATIGGVLDSVPPRVERFGDAVGAQAAGAAALRTVAERHYAQALETIDRELDSGNLLRGEVLDRWREHVGTGEFMDRMQSGVGRLRDRIKGLFTGKSVPDAEVQGQLESNLEILIKQSADQAALATVEEWETLPGGAELLVDVERGIDRASTGLSARLATEIAAWEDDVLALVSDQAGSKVAVARTLSWGINGIGVALMIAVFSHTGGLTGGEIGVAGGTAAVSQTVLSAIFGEQAVRDLARAARKSLADRLENLFAAERLRFDDLLAVVPDADAVDKLQKAVDELVAARP